MTNDNEEMTEEHARAAFAAVHTAQLDALRTELPSMLTSHVLAWMSNAGQLAERLALRPQSEIEIKEAQDVLSAALFAICDEIDVPRARRLASAILPAVCPDAGHS